MALADIKARLKTQVKTADPNGNVYTFRRNLSAEADQAALIGADGRAHFWFIFREMTALTDLVVNENFVQQDDTLVIEGFYGVKDADDSEEAFDLIVDAVLQAVNSDRRPVAGGGTKLNGTVQTADTPALRKMDFHMYGPSQMLCHHVEIVMKVTPRYLQ
jgi:hypothetical protein